MPPSDAKVHAQHLALIASPGGHLDLLTALTDAFVPYERVWLIPPGARHSALRASGERVHTIRLFSRRQWSTLPGSIRDAGRSLRRWIPDVVVTSGAGVVVPYCVIARLFGARLIFIETMARVTSSSLSGRLLTRMADATFVQWPENLANYPTATVCVPPLLTLGEASDEPRKGTFVALGTHWQPFERLLKLVEVGVREGLLPRPVLAQTGRFNFESDVIETVSSVTPARVDELMRGSETVICHGGAGIISTALRAGRRPLVLARRLELNEHIDDHQQEIVDKLASLDLVRDIKNGIDDEAIAYATAAPAAAQTRFAGPEMRVALHRQLAAMEAGSDNR